MHVYMYKFETGKFFHLVLKNLHVDYVHVYQYLISYVRDYIVHTED